MDAEVDGESLLSMFRHDPSTVAPETWLAFYEKLHTTKSKMGLLPFRVAQLYDTMVQAPRDGGEHAVAGALCAGGTMAQ